MKSKLKLFTLIFPVAVLAIEAAASDIQPGSNLYKQTSSPSVSELDNLIINLISNQWLRPATARNGMSVELLIEMIPDGTITNTSIINSSGDEAFDRSAVSAVREVGRILEIQYLDRAVFNKIYRQRHVIFSPNESTHDEYDLPRSPRSKSAPETSISAKKTPPQEEKLSKLTVSDGACVSMLQYLYQKTNYNTFLIFANAFNTPPSSEMTIWLEHRYGASFDSDSDARNIALYFDLNDKKSKLFSALTHCDKSIKKKTGGNQIIKDPFIYTD